MGNEPLCGKDTRDFRNSTYMVCGKEPEFRNSTSINIVNYVPIISGPPLNFEKQETFKKVERSASEFCQTSGLDTMYIPLVARIIAYGHNNIFAAYRNLPEHNKEQFLEEIKFADIDFLDSLYHKFILGEKESKKAITPPTKIVEKELLSEGDKNKFIETGLNMLSAGEVGFVFLCAGSSSRFQFQEKFIYPLELNSNKTVIEILLLRLRKNLRVPENEVASVPIVFACSEYNRNQTETFIRSRNYCGFDPSKIRYLTAPNLPVLNSKGKICISFEYKIINRPCGTLKCVEELLGSGLFNWLKNSKVSTIHIMGTENLLENPGDPLTIGYTKENKLDMVGKCTEPIFPTEEFSRYSGANDNKTYLISPEEILNSQYNESTIEKLMEKCPIAMNSIVCGLSELKAMTKDYQNSMFLSLEYFPLKKTENSYDFERNKPLVNAPVFIFEKEIGHLFTCNKRYALMKVGRDEFLPILSKNGSYSMKEACKKLVQKSESSLNISRISS